jgi:hypothetical protein
MIDENLLADSSLTDGDNEANAGLADIPAGNCLRPHEPASPPTPVKATVIKGSTKADLLSYAKAAIDEGESLLRAAAEALALAQKDFNATQREIAEAVGRSASWVNRVLKWRRSGYKDYSPTTKAGRVAHAQQRVKVSKPGKPDTTTTKTPATPRPRAAPYTLRLRSHLPPRQGANLNSPSAIGGPTWTMRAESKSLPSS